MLPICHIMNHFHDKKRKIEYVRIKKMLNLENSNMNNSPSKNKGKKS